ncbi:MAG: endonuclease domain-containing protein [Hyphomicrobiaceae bacterium]
MRRAQPWKTVRARVLRANDTSAESKLWGELRNRQLAGLKFVRQVPIGPYFVDFVCRERRLIVEVDGATHGTDAEIAADALRDVELQRLGYRIFRVTNSDVFDNMDGVLETVLDFAESGDEL